MVFVFLLRLSYVFWGRSPPDADHFDCDASWFAQRLLGKRFFSLSDGHMCVQLALGVCRSVLSCPVWILEKTVLCIFTSNCVCDFVLTQRTIFYMPFGIICRKSCHKFCQLYEFRRLPKLTDHYNSDMEFCLGA
jgi:hypothetical protein